ncbi:MAG: hypothetical protein WKG07_43105 [Hymenobacter sp.]
MLIDEFGTGTEPSLGGAIAEAVLEQLNQARAFGVITTHYTNLKNFARENGGPRQRRHALRPRAPATALPPRNGQAGLAALPSRLPAKSACPGRSWSAPRS